MTEFDREDGTEERNWVNQDSLPKLDGCDDAPCDDYDFDLTPSTTIRTNRPFTSRLCEVNPSMEYSASISTDPRTCSVWNLTEDSGGHVKGPEYLYNVREFAAIVSRA
ncbi:hypothetical protein C2857_005742 [Epichloe festucae Fl1]|uniref:Uncharacterized protein n=1 Tax=Epichloe festucae (strain Fl1) TaxID=877507 RepID=A0A7S9KTB8_EPIFF|nr:hypothetical protein C2857_005742 [Epichloe festucae Fl1]